MSVEQYFQGLQQEIAAWPAVSSTVITFEKRDPSHGFVRGELFFVDGTVLHIREFVHLVNGVQRQTYAYQYMAADHSLIFRYDNADHYAHLQLPNPPQHKHEGQQSQVVSSSAPSLSDVLAEIEQLVNFG